MTNCQVDTSELKKLVKNSTAVLVLDGGEPSFVIMDYKTYRNLIEEGEGRKIPVNSEQSQTGSSNGHLVNGSFRGRGPSQALSDINHAITTRNSKEGEVDVLEKINKDILALKDEVEEEEKSLFVD